MTLDTFVQAITNAMPERLPERAQILADVRAHVDERVQQGDSADVIIARLGDPTRLAARYLAELVWTPARFWPRAIAKVLDLSIIVVGMLLIAAVAFAIHVAWVFLFAPVYALATFVLYAVGEVRSGQTPGKHVMGLLVVRESGATVSAGQVIVRYLPWILQIFWIDAAFALFTDKHQRAFELLSKTRTVDIANGSNAAVVPSHATAS